ncbi:DUF6293 family protein [Methanocaldococcus indicus]|uniref:HFX_2341 family transcriptional regulator domain-containing protein n=1 Tax=Methanocaldococcus indicus TaxID=213231 RepID=UPI003C6D24EE
MEKIRGGIHIAVQGYEVDRITEVPIKCKAEKVYLICMPEDKDSERGKSFKNIITKRFEENNIEYEIENAYLFDLEEIAKKIKEIIKKERENYPDAKFYINLSSGSSIGCVAGTICSMILNKKDSKIIPYYVSPKKILENLTDEEIKLLKKEYGEYLPRTFGVKDVKLIYPFEIKLPREELLIILKYLKRAKRGLTIKELSFLTRDEILEELSDETIKKLLRKDKISQHTIKKYYNKIKELKEIIDDDVKKIIEWRRHSRESFSEHSDLVWINKNVVEKLLEWELIEVEKIGRNKYVKISDKGKMLLNYI